MRWLERHWETVFRSLDFYVGAWVGVALIVTTAISEGVREQGVTVALAATALGAALLAVVLAAIAIIVTFLDKHYRQVLRGAPDGVAGAMFPYQIVAVVGATAACSGLLTAVLWNVIPVVAQAFALGITVGSCLWALVGTAQLVEITLFHGIKRVELHDGIDEQRRRLAERKAKTSA